MEFAGPAPWLPGFVFLLLVIASIALFVVPALKPWRPLAWVILIALVVLFGATLIWTFTVDRLPN